MILSCDCQNTCTYVTTMWDNVIAHVEVDLFNSGFCNYICLFSSVNIKHLFLIVCVFAQVWIILIVHERYVPLHVASSYKNVCLKGQHEVLKDHCFFFLLHIWWRLDLSKAQFSHTTINCTHGRRHSMVYFQTLKGLKLPSVLVSKRNVSIC